MKNAIILFIFIIIFTTFNVWSAPSINEAFLKNINTDADETSCTLTGNGKLLVFARKPVGSNNGDLFFTEFKNGKWTEVMPLTDLNSDADEMSPHISSDGKLILFSSDRQGSLKDNSVEKPSYDIYYSEKKGDTWEKPVLLFGAVNTRDDEINPHLSKNGKILYFTRVRFNDANNSKIIKVRNKNDSWEDVQTAKISYNSIVDIYMLKSSYFKPGFYITGFKKKNTEKREIFYSDDSGKNIYSINGGSPSGDEMSICELNKKSLIVSSNENGIEGSYDFYIRKVSGVLKKATPSTFFLKIENNEYENPDGIKIKILYFSSLGKNSWPEKSEIKTPDESGAITLSADPEVKRILVLPGESDMKPFSVEFLTANDSLSTATIKVETAPENDFIIKPVYYEFNSCKLLLKDIPYIHELINYMRENENVSISIEGYSDGIGSYRSNLDISVKRAEKIRDYLIKEGISKDRIETKGHGYVKNKNHDTSQYNRRVEFIFSNQ